MNDDLDRYLDGEASKDSLPGELLPEAEAWDRLVETFRAELPESPAPAWLEQKVMAEIEALPEPGAFGRIFRWVAYPKQIRVSPLLAGAAAAVVALLLLVDGPPQTAPGQTEDVVVYVQFALDAPGAQSVSVAGDFEGWEASHPLEDVDGDGIWTGRIALRPGVHAYMFLVDESTWMTDPRAQRYAEDGFGNRNAVLAVAAPST